MPDRFSETTARLLIRCPDKPGIVSAVSTFLYNHGANITELDQHSTDPIGGTFFMRLEFQTPNLDLSRNVLEQTFERAVASRFNMDWRISYAGVKKNVAIFVSKHDHALLDLLWQASRGNLAANVSMVITGRRLNILASPFTTYPSSRSGSTKPKHKCWKFWATRSI